jgi:hypothetical protein
LTYYWCAGLQRGVKSVAVSAGRATAFIGLILMGLPALIVEGWWVLAGYFPPPSWTVDYNMSITPLILVPLAFSALGFGCFVGRALGGGAIIDIARRHRLSATVTVLLISPVLILMMAIFTAGERLAERFRLDCGLGDRPHGQRFSPRLEVGLG